MDDKPNSYGTLYLLPTLLGGDDMDIIAPQTRQIAVSLSYFIVENARTARRHLLKMGIKESGKTIDELSLRELDKHSTLDTRALDTLLQPLIDGYDMGLMSEAGCPAIADPGNALVRRAHERGIVVAPTAGTSSLLLALMASGMNGQQFAFNGYLPQNREARIKRIKQLELRALREYQTQLFIETPYRNQSLVADLLQHCQADTRLCIAAQLTLPDQYIRTLSIAQWRSLHPIPDWHKKMLVFVLSG